MNLITDGLDPNEIQKHLPAIFGIEAELPIFRKVDMRDESRKPIMVYKNGKYSVKKKLKQVTNNSFMLDRILARFLELLYDGRRFNYNADTTTFFHRLGMTYVDQTKQMELCSPESSNPFETAMYLSKQKELLAKVLKERDFLAFTSVTNNVSTFGFHENYMSSWDFQEFSEFHVKSLIPHFVSRMIYLGTGGVGKGDVFSISPRSTFIENITSSAAVSERGMFLTRLDPLTTSGIRVQPICADHPVDEETIALMLGTSALTVRLGELGLLPDTNIEWFKSIDIFSEVLGEINSDIFSKAILYQRQLLANAKTYLSWLELNGLPDFFDSKLVAEEIFAIWEHRLNTLEKFIETSNINHITPWSEWAKKYKLIKDARTEDRVDIPSNENLMTPDEQRICSAMTQLSPDTALVSKFQSELNESCFEFTEWQTCPRAELRTDIINLLTDHPVVVENNLDIDIRWWAVTIEYPPERRKGYHVARVYVPTPHHGQKDDLKYLLDALEEFDVHKKTTSAYFVAHTKYDKRAFTLPNEAMREEIEPFDGGTRFWDIIGQQ